MDEQSTPSSDGADARSEAPAGQETLGGAVTSVPHDSSSRDGASSAATSTGLLAQLQQMIAQVAAAHVTREFAAKAAELAALAAERAGPAARSLADRTEVVGQSVVERATTFASSMRSDETAHADAPTEPPAEGKAGI
jgi:hypothetical protein